MDTFFPCALIARDDGPGYFLVLTHFGHSFWIKRFTSRTRSRSKIPKWRSSCAAVQTTPLIRTAPWMSSMRREPAVTVPFLNFNSGESVALMGYWSVPTWHATDCRPDLNFASGLVKAAAMSVRFMVNFALHVAEPRSQ